MEEIASPEASQVDPGQIHRGVVCIRNFLVGLDAAERKEVGLAAQQLGIVQAIVRVFRNGASNPANPVLRPAAEALKALMESGVSVSA